MYKGSITKNMILDGLRKVTENHRWLQKKKKKKTFRAKKKKKNGLFDKEKELEPK